jgi:ATP-dependent Clp protease ATP-binding subunit ClpA
LNIETVEKIVHKFINDLNLQLKDKNIEIVADDNSVKWLAKNGYDKKMGARPLARLIDNKIKSPLSRRVLFGDLVDGGNIHIQIAQEEVTFTVTERSKPLTKQQKKLLKRGSPLILEEKLEDAQT